MSSRPAIGQADQRDDGEHITRRDDAREPTGLRVGQRPGLDELRQQRRDNRDPNAARANASRRLTAATSCVRGVPRNGGSYAAARGGGAKLGR